MNPARPILYLLLLAACTGCSLSRILPEGGRIYTGAKIKIEKAEKKTAVGELKAACETVLKTPKPNKKFLGVRWGLRFHNLFHTKKEKGLCPWLQKKLGEPPVVYHSQVTAQTEQLLQNRAFNLGFFKTGVDSEVKMKKRKAGVKYTVRVERPYLISHLSNGVEDSLIRLHINRIQGASLLKTGQPYHLELCKQERERITAALRQNGFYFFRSDFLKFRADTTRSSHEVQLELVLKEKVDSTMLLPRAVRQITVYPDLNFKKGKAPPIDTLDVEGFKIIASWELIRPSMLREAIVLKAGERYSTTAHQATLQRLSFLRNYQFIDVQFERPPTSDSLLDVVVNLTPRKPVTVEGSVGASIKAGLYAGPELSLSYLNRNVFRGAEQLRLTFNGNYNYPLTNDIASRVEQGITFELSKPGLIVPFKKRWWAEGLIAQSKISFSYAGDRIRVPLKGTEEFLEEEGFPILAERLNQDSTFSPFFSLNKYDFSLAYQWYRRPEIKHEFSPINLVLQAPRYEVEEFRRLLVLVFLLDGDEANEGLVLNLEKMLIIKPSYVFQYDSRLKKLKTHNFFYRGKMAVSGNRLLRQSNFISNNNLESQFFQLENDWRYYLRFSKKQTLAWRLSTKFSFPFRNEVLLPFFDLYAVGGPNSLRAFQPRRVGPGSVEPTGQTFFFTGTGDILLEGSMEWRPKLSDLFELGFFVDAGNVWLFNGGIGNNALATFNVRTFPRQLALGTGFGFRFDFDVLLLRMDFGFPLTKPWLPEGQRWVGDEIGLRDGVFNLAFGYSF